MPESSTDLHGLQFRSIKPNILPAWSFLRSHSTAEDIIFAYGYLSAARGFWVHTRRASSHWALERRNISSSTALRIPQRACLSCCSSEKANRHVTKVVDEGCLVCRARYRYVQGYEKLEPDQQIHIGFSISDTRKLERLLQEPRLDRPCNPAIRSYQFTVGNSAYCRRASNKFLFGTSQPIALGDVKPKFESLTADRDVVVVLHGANSDLKITQQLGINIEETSLYIIDTNKVAQFSLQLHYRWAWRNYSTHCRYHTRTYMQPVTTPDSACRPCSCLQSVMRNFNHRALFCRYSRHSERWHKPRDPYPEQRYRHR